MGWTFSTLGTRRGGRGNILIEAAIVAPLASDVVRVPVLQSAQGRRQSDVRVLTAVESGEAVTGAPHRLRARA